MQKAIFLDRDGTLNKDTGYVHRPEDWKWLPFAREALARAQKAGYALIVASNQSGIARGFFTEDDLARLERHIDADLSGIGVTIRGWYHCPHLPEITGPCQCRKPAPGMLLAAQKDLAIDMSQSWMIGDRLRDCEAGLAAGLSTIKISDDRKKKSAEDEKAEKLGARLVSNLSQAIDVILGHTKDNPRFCHTISQAANDGKRRR